MSTLPPGSGNWQVPVGVTQISVQVWGGGGSGGASNTNNDAGSGGGAGGYATRNNVAVTPLQFLAFTTGIGGVATQVATSASGTASQITLPFPATTMIGFGGAGGTRNGGAGGIGGSASGGTTNTAGGNGTAGGGGTGGNGGTASSGGGGGPGQANVNGLPGGAPGGGGGGGEAYSFFGTTSRIGGDGGTGRITITYIKPTISLVNPTSGCIGNNIILTGTNFTGATVTFNGIPATVVSATATSMTVTIPAGATSGPIRVTLGGNYAEANFTIDTPVLGGPSSVCVGSTITATSSTSGTWSSDTPGFALVSPSGVITGLFGGFATIRFTSTTGCTATKSVIVSPVTSLTAFIGSQQVCSGGTTGFTVSAVGSLLNYQWFNGAGALSNGGNISGANTSFLTISNVTTNDIYYCVVTGLCGNATTNTASVTVTPRATITAHPITPQIVCEGGTAIFSITTTGAVMGYRWYKGSTPLVNSANVSGAFTNSLTLSNITLADASANYYCEVDGTGPCPTVNSNMATLVVNALPSITSGPVATQTVCAGTAVSFGVVVSGVNLNYQWYNGATLLVDGGAISGATSATLNLSTTTLADSSTNYHVLVTNECGAPVSSASAELIVNERPFIPTQSATICSGDSFSVLPVNGVPTAATIIPANTTYSWNAPTMPAGLTGGSAASAQTIISQTLTNNTNTALTATYLVTPTSGTTGSCSGTPFTVNVLVNPRPFIQNSLQTACTGTTFFYNPTNGGGNIVPAGTTYSWPTPVISPIGSVSGATTGTNLSSVTQTLLNTTGVDGTATYTVTATDGTCVGTTFTVIFTVRATPDAAALPIAQTICSGTAIGPITLSNPNSVFGPIQYHWTRDKLTEVTGLPNEGFGDTITGTLVNTTLVPQTVTFTITTESEYGCVSLPTTATVTINPQGSATALPATQTVCSGAAIVPIVITTQPTGTTFTWVRTPNANLTGLDNGSGDITGSMTNTSTTAQTATFTITPLSAGCPGTPVTVSVLVNPRPTVTVTVAQASVCSNIAITPLTISSNIGTAVLSWTRDNSANISGPLSGSGATISGTWINLTNSPQTLIFTVTATLNGCSSTATTQTIILPATGITATPVSQNICHGGNLATITAVPSTVVAGTEYRWSRTNTTNIINIAAGSPGWSTTIPVINATNVQNTTATTQITTITIETRTPAGCQNSFDVTVTVYAPLTQPVIGASQTVCGGSQPAAFTMTTLPTGGTGTYTYQWQTSDSATGPWANIAGATGASYQAPTQAFGADNSFYQLIVTSGSCGSVLSTSSVSVEVVNNFNFTFDIVDDIATTNNIVCSGTVFNPEIATVHFWTSYVRFQWAADPAYISPATGGPLGNTTFAIYSAFNFPNLTATNNTNASVTTSIAVTPRVYRSSNNAFLCAITPEIITLTIRPRPVAIIASPANNTTICSGTSANVTVNGNITDDTMYYTVTRSANAALTSSLTFPYTSAATAAGAPFILNDILTNTSTAATFQSVTYTITPRGTSGACAGAPVTITIRVARQVVPGSIGTDHSVCVGGDPNNLTQTAAAAGGTLTYAWHSSTTSATGPWTPISGATNTTYDPPAGLTQTTWFIRETISTVNGTACNAFSNAVMVSVNQINPGTVSGNQTICSGSTPSAFTIGTAATGTGTITYLWQFNTIGCGSATWTNAPGVNNLATYAPGVLTQTTYFRRVTTPNGASACADTGICITVTVNQVNPGTVGIDQVLCGNNPSVFTEATAATGDGVLTYQWQRNTVSCDPSSPWANIGGATSSFYDPPIIANTTYYRRVVTSTLNGVSCSAYSNCVTATLNAVSAGQIGPNRTVCMGGDPTAIGFTTAATGTGLTYQWQSSTAAAGPYANILGATTDSYDPPAGAIQTLYYQCVVTGTVNSSPCTVTTTPATVFVNQIFAATIAGNQNLCAGEDPSALTMTIAATGSGSISYQWQSAPSATGPWTNIATGTSYDPPVLGQTTYFQLVATSLFNGENCSNSSNIVIVNQNGKSWNGSASTDWNNASNWTPAGVPTSAHCVVIPDVTNDPIISGTNFVAHALNLTVLNGGNLHVNPNNSIEVTNFVNVNTGGIFFIANDASLVQIDNVPNTGIVTIQRITPPVYRYDYTYWNSPVTLASNYTLGNLSALTQPDKFYSWNPSISGGNGNWNQESVATIMNPAKGYIVRAPNTHSTSPAITAPYTATFTGTPNNGDFQSPISKGSLAPAVVFDKLNLIGNPYPSAIDADLFLNHPANAAILDGTMYFWTHHSPPSAAYPNPFYGNFQSNYTASDYATYTSAMGGTATVPSGYGGAPPSGYVASGQSFFIKATAAGNAVFNNGMRVTGLNNVFFRQANPFTNATPALERHRVWLNLANDQGAFSQILVGYAEGATNGKDRLYDGDTFASNAVTFYSLIDETRLTVQGRALPFEVADMVPLGYKATIAASFTIGIDHLDGLFEGQNIYLEDKVLNVIHDLKVAPYVFNSAIGTFNDRFLLRYTTQQLGVGDHDLSTLTAFISEGKLFAQSPETIESIEIFDISGKRIVTFSPDSNLFEEPFPYSQGIYIAKVKLANGSTADVKLAN
ncbi:MAG: hypothetical protein EOO50_12945 [Flavobacterium sp.]|nr:MAG: hypothetical protein EOO50_12945 [Flavobacterium sp.]